MVRTWIVIFPVSTPCAVLLAATDVSEEPTSCLSWRWRQQRA